MASVLNVRTGYEPQPMFDRRARIIYTIIAVELALDVLLYAALGMRFNAPVGSVAFGIAVVLCAAFAARRIGLSRTATWLEATALAYLQGAAGWALLYPATVFALPYQDWWLSAVDRALGFDFPAVYRATIDWPLGPIYRSFDWQAAAVIPLLVLLRRDVWPFVLALSLAMIPTIILYPFATAIGPVEFYHLGGHANWTGVIEAFRDHGVRTVEPNMLVGLVSLPSYHAACGAIVIWATWRTPARWLFLPLNVGLIFATIPFGQHYLVDVIAGVAVAVVAISFSGRAMVELKSPCPMRSAPSPS